MTARVEGVALADSDNRQQTATNGATIPNRLEGVLTAGRRKTAAWSQQRADSNLILSNQPDQ